MNTPRPAYVAVATPVPVATEPGALPSAEDTGPDGQRLQDVTLNAMAQMLRTHKGNVSAAAKALGVSRNTIYRKKGSLPPNFLD